ncbi:hypothetical protein E3U43_016046 [Larimichthys crocea]|uniref:Uncharacterized protein n=1 Tax=Larimichthys crocea TaxID=215358 RepID=A0ACD3QGX2_LARCR|nr:hypothetical protein E3U43_016046 [Larimichthys crocea]
MRPSYRKTYKAEEERKRLEEERVAKLARQNEALKRKHENLKRQLRQKPASPFPFHPHHSKEQV